MPVSSVKNTSVPAKIVRRQEYRPPAYLVDRCTLDLTLDPKKTHVKSTLTIRRNPKAGQKALPFVLDGEEMELVRIAINGRALTKSEYKIEPHSLTVPKVPIQFTLEIETIINPAANGALSGLYLAGGDKTPMLVTQCEAEGFRRITYYPDRPDVLARFTVTLTADAKKFPVLLSNGNLVAKGKKGKDHWVKWEDPFPKPCYLFALVAGDLACVPDTFTTKSNRKVKIEAYVDHGQEKKVKIALNALKRAMKWDEDVYGLEYDLDRFMLVATSHFNMGAMENKGLNIFADDAVLGDPATATDNDIAFIEAVVAHEYFHNWTGNRVTCRDWFQLSLKEGLTVFREQQFIQTMYSSGVERVKDARNIRLRQFAEDAGPNAHAIRPDSYQAIDNFYTSTVYDKGAEVCRMLHTLLGEKAFRRGMDYYFKQNDGEAATCDDFVNAMAEANDRDLSQFMRWYMQAGTPRLSVQDHYDSKRQRLTLNIRQETPETPGQARKQPVLIPLAMGLLDKTGRDIIGTKILEVRKGQESFTFEGLEDRPVVSLLRQFSAPVRLEREVSDEDLMHLLAYDNDTYTRWDAGQTLYRNFIEQTLRGEQVALPAEFVEALRKTLRDDYLDEDYRALMFAVPPELDVANDLAARTIAVDPDHIHAARLVIRRQIAQALEADFAAVFTALQPDPAGVDAQAMGERALRSCCLAFLMLADQEKHLGKADLLLKSSNMTDQLDGLSQLCEHAPKQAAKALESFVKTWKKDDLVVRKWLQVQSGANHKDTLDNVKKLMKLPVYDRKQPKNVRSLVGVLAHSNPWNFHRADGAGYKLVAGEIAILDKFNPIIAARLATAFQNWRDLEPKRQKLIEKELKGLKAMKTLSRNTAEIVLKTLAMPAKTGMKTITPRIKRAA